MPYWSKDSKSAAAALSDYETALFKKILSDESMEKLQAKAANDSDKLSQVFANLK
jgi:hypothetical protein